MKKTDKDLSLAKLLSYSFGSSESLFTISNQYLFASIITDNIHLKKMFKKAYFDLTSQVITLAELIFSLGEIPFLGEYMFGRINYWNGYYVYYEKNVNSLLDVCIYLEQKIIYSFNVIISEIDNIHVKNVINNFLKVHYKFLDLWINYKKSIVYLCHGN